jgi:hypothetical protein
MTKIVIKSPRYAGMHAQNTDMLNLIGAAHGNPGLKNWPDAGFPPVKIQDISVWVRPIERVPGKKSSKHRVMCMCPKCGHVLSAGRLHQHVCKEGK